MGIIALFKIVNIDYQHRHLGAIAAVAFDFGLQFGDLILSLMLPRSSKPRRQL
jgi:hypothetical protein